MNVVNLFLKMLISPRPQSYPKGYFVNEKVSGERLLSYNNIISEKRHKDDARHERNKKSEFDKKTRA